MEFHEHTTGQLLDYTRTRLAELRGQWEQVHAASGVPYFTISKIAQGVTTNPRLDTFLPLLSVLKHHEATGIIALPAPKRMPGRRARQTATTPRP